MAMEVELDLDDDVFFADIRKQLNLLITDDDEQNPLSLSSPTSFQGLFRGNYQTSATPYMMYNEQINYNLVRESKGTGVFIPRCSHPRRKRNHHPHQKKQGRLGSVITPRHVHDNNSTTLSNNNQENINHHHASTNPRRT